MSDEKAYLQMSREALLQRLGSISITSGKLPEEDMDKEQRKAFVADCTFVYEKVLKHDLERLIDQQGEFIAINAEEWGQVLFGRGTVNGFLLLKEIFEARRNEHIGNMQKEGKPEEDWYSGSPALIPPEGQKPQ